MRYTIGIHLVEWRYCADQRRIQFRGCGYFVPFVPFVAVCSRLFTRFPRVGVNVPSSGRPADRACIQAPFETLGGDGTESLPPRRYASLPVLAFLGIGRREYRSQMLLLFFLAPSPRWKCLRPLGHLIQRARKAPSGVIQRCVRVQ